MKKVLMVAFVSGLSAQVEADSSGVNFYAGVSAVGSWTSSDFKMDYEVNKSGTFANAVPHAYHKDNSIGRVGAGFAVGVKKKFENGFFVGGEFDYTLSRAKHHLGFTYEEDYESPTSGAQPGDTVSYINVKHGDELALAFKFGKDCKSCDFYGIVGVTTKNVDIEYAFDEDGIWGTPDDDEFDVSTKERAWGAVFGLGGSKKINDRISLSLEYRYKLYGSAKDDVDCKAKSCTAFNGTDHDTSDRHFKVKSDKHEVSLGITVNI